MTKRGPLPKKWGKHTNKMYGKLMCKVKKKGSLKKGYIFLNLHFWSHFLQFRAVIFDMFRESFKYRRNQFTERFKEVLGKEPASKIEFDRLIKVSLMRKLQLLLCNLCTVF